MEILQANDVKLKGPAGGSKLQVHHLALALGYKPMSILGVLCAGGGSSRTPQNMYS